MLIDACWAFSYVAGNTSNGGFNERDVVISSGVLPLVASLLPRPNPTVVTPALRTIGTIAAGTDEQTRLAVEAGILPHLAALFSSQVTSTRKEALWTISNIMACDSDIIQVLQVCNCLIVVIQMSLSFQLKYFHRINCDGSTESYMRCYVNIFVTLLQKSSPVCG